jgi:hypothetical protein
MGSGQSSKSKDYGCRKGVNVNRFRNCSNFSGLQCANWTKTAVARLNKLGCPNPPSWQIADDDEFERFLKRF